MVLQNLRLLKIICLTSLGAISFALGSGAYATTYSSTNFKIENPAITGGGISGSSTNFQVISAVGQTGEGEGTSTSYDIRSGVVYFAELTTAPVISSATAGEEKVTLVWSAASGNVAVDHYELGQATVSGAQTYTNIGSVLTTVATSLTGGTTYYFTIRAVDASGTITATSAEVSATPTAATTPGGGGGGGVVIPPPPITPPDTDDGEPPVDEEETEPEVEIEAPNTPTALSGQPINATTIRWLFNDNSDNEDSFILQADNQILGNAPANSNFIDEAVRPNTFYSGREIFARNTAGDSSASIFPDVYSLIESPTSLSAQTFGVPNAIQLRALSASQVFSNLNQGLSALEFVNTTQSTSSGWVKTDNIIVSGLATGQPYSFVVRARNQNGVTTPFSTPFTFTLPRNQQPGQDIPNQPGAEDTDPDVTEEPVEKFDLEIVYPEPDVEIDGKQIEVLVQTIPYAIVTLQINATSATGLADASGRARFNLQDLPFGKYLLVAVANSQEGNRSVIERRNFYVNATEDAGESVKLPPIITPQAPSTPPPPQIIQPPLTSAEIVTEIEGPVKKFECGIWCVYMAIAIALYILILLTLWYVVWWYINRPFLPVLKNKKKRNSKS